MFFRENSIFDRERKRDTLIGMSGREKWIRRGVGIVVLGTVVFLVAIPFPCGGGSPESGLTVRALSNAKQIYLGLKMYAGDHNGEFPSRQPDGSPITTANQAYRALIPEYIRAESIFYIKGSAWTLNKPDDDIEGDRKLAAGENAFAYVPNMKDSSNPAFPIVATGFAEETPGLYSPDPTAKGGIPKGYGVVIVRVDGSGKVEAFGKQDKDLLKLAPGWLAPNQAPLNPE